MSAAVSIDRSPSDSSSLATWGFSLSLATLGTAILWSTRLGINWGVWTACVVTAFFAVLRDRFGAVGAPTLAAGLWAVVLAFGTAITTNGFHIALLVMCSLVLLAVALVTAGDSSVDALQPTVATLAPILALSSVLSGLASEAMGSSRSARSPAVATLARTTFITAPVVIALVLLLAEADPVFASMRHALAHILPDDVIPRALFFALLLGVTLGAYSTAQRGHLGIHAPPKAHGAMLAATERRTLLFALASVMWLFVGSAAISLMKNPAAVAGSGVTYAEYVHRGFAELSIAATIVIGAILITRRSWVSADAWARGAALAGIAGEGGMVGIAFMRVIRYEQAYGYTNARLQAQGYMLVLGCMSALLLLEIVRRSQSTRFAYHSATAALTVFMGSVVYNTDAWIVKQNVDRYVVTGAIDLQYLENQARSSEDAVPVLIESVPRLHDKERAELVRYLRNRDAKKEHEPESPWYSWNYRDRKSAHTLRAFRGNDLVSLPSMQEQNTGK